jgi:hypothetical protein
VTHCIRWHIEIFHAMYICQVSSSVTVTMTCESRPQSGDRRSLGSPFYNILISHRPDELQLEVFKTKQFLRRLMKISARSSSSYYFCFWPMKEARCLAPTGNVCSLRFVRWLKGSLAGPHGHGYGLRPPFTPAASRLGGT